MWHLLYSEVRAHGARTHFCGKQGGSMADIDSLDIQIQVAADQANKSLDILTDKLNSIHKSLVSIGQGVDFSQTYSKAISVTKNLSPALKEVSASAEKMKKSLSSSLSSFAEKYKDLGKNFQAFGSTSSIEKQIVKYSNALEVAKLKKEDLEKSGKTNGQSYEDAVKDTYKYSNVLENLKKQLEDIQSAQAKFNIKVNLSDAERTLESFREQLADFDKIIEAGGTETEAGLTFPIRGLEMSLEQLRSLYPEAHELISSFEAEIVRANNLSSNASAQQFGQIDLSYFKEFGDNLSKLVVPEVREENLDKLYNSLDKTEQKLEALRVQLENGITMGRITENVEDSGFVKLQEQIALTEKETDSLREKIAQVESQANGTGCIERLSSVLTGLSTAGRVAINGLSGFTSILRKLGAGISNAISKIGRLAKNFLSLTKLSNSANISFSNGFKTILKYGLGISSLFVLFNKLRNAIKEGMKNLILYSDETNASVSMLRNSLTQFKNATAAAVSPLLNALAPAINQIAQFAIKAVNAVNQLISALLGNGTWIRAKKLTDNYKDSLSGVAKAADKVMKGVRAFDELNVINLPDDNSSGSGGGAGAADMFETVDIEDRFKNLSDWLKQMWENADFTELGSYLGLQLKNSLDRIDWEPIYTTAQKIGKSIATLINGFVEVEGLGNSLGSTLGEIVNTGIAGITAFFDNTHWNSVGQFIGEGLNGVVETIGWAEIGHLLASKWNALFETLNNIATTFDWANLGLNLSNGINTVISDFDWAKAGESLSNLAKGLLDSIIVFFENTNWQELGNSVADFIGSIDWSGIADRLFEGIGAALGSLSAFIGGLLEDAWSSVISWWKDTAFEDGQFTMEGLLYGISEALVNIGSWIKEHIFDPFINGFKKAFGIASPSKVMLEQGSFLMQGLLNGILPLIDKVTSVFSNIKDKILNIWNILKSKTTEIWLGIKNAIKIPINGIIGFINSMLSSVFSGINSMSRALNSMKFDVPDWLPVIGGKTFSFNIPEINAPQIPYLANGGLTITKTLAMIGEKGKEAVLPLTNSAVMKEIAQAISDPILRTLSSDMPVYAYAPVPSIDTSYKNFRQYANNYTPKYESVTNYRDAYNQDNAETNALLKELISAVKQGHKIEINGEPIVELVKDDFNEHFRRTGTAAILV